MYILQIHSDMGNWKQWKWKPERENGNSQNLMQMNVRVKPLINDHLLKTTFVQRSHKNYIPKTEISCCRDHLYVKATFQ